MNIGKFNLKELIAKPKQRDIFIAAAVTAAWFALILLIWLGTRGLEDRWEFGVFLGRFHILALHLPVSFLLGALAVEIFPFFPVLRPYAQGGLVMLWFGLFGSIAATILGFLLMVGDHIGGSFMTVHLWTGLGVVVLTAVALVMKLLEVRPSLLIGTLAANLALTSYSSHEGGNMVHGEEYLGRYAPAPIAPLLGYSPKEAPQMAAKLDDRLIYQDVLQPIFDVKCVECHTAGKVEGKLRMDSFEELAKGGAVGEEFVPGKAEDSELHIRVVLDPDDDDYMPPKGKAEPMTPGEIAILGWWINQGASPTLTVGAAKPDEAIRKHLEAHFLALSAKKPTKKDAAEGGAKKESAQTLPSSPAQALAASAGGAVPPAAR